MSISFPNPSPLPHLAQRVYQRFYALHDMGLCQKLGVSSIPFLIAVLECVHSSIVKCFIVFLFLSFLIYLSEC